MKRIAEKAERTDRRDQGALDSSPRPTALYPPTIHLPTALLWPEHIGAGAIRAERIKKGAKRDKGATGQGGDNEVQGESYRVTFPPRQEGEDEGGGTVHSAENPWGSEVWARIGEQYRRRIPRPLAQRWIARLVVGEIVGEAAGDAVVSAVKSLPGSERASGRSEPLSRSGQGELSCGLHPLFPRLSSIGIGGNWGGGFGEEDTGRGNDIARNALQDNDSPSVPSSSIPSLGLPEVYATRLRGYDPGYFGDDGSGDIFGDDLNSIADMYEWMVSAEDGDGFLRQAAELLAGSPTDKALHRYLIARTRLGLLEGRGIGEFIIRAPLPIRFLLAQALEDVHYLSPIYADINASLPPLYSLRHLTRLVRYLERSRRRTTMLWLSEWRGLFEGAWQVSAAWGEAYDVANLSMKRRDQAHALEKQLWLMQWGWAGAYAAQIVRMQGTGVHHRSLREFLGMEAKNAQVGEESADESSMDWLAAEPCRGEEDLRRHDIFLPRSLLLSGLTFQEAIATHGAQTHSIRHGIANVYFHRPDTGRYDATLLAWLRSPRKGPAFEFDKRNSLFKAPKEETGQGEIEERVLALVRRLVGDGGEGVEATDGRDTPASEFIEALEVLIPSSSAQLFSRFPLIVQHTGKRKASDRGDAVPMMDSATDAITRAEESWVALALMMTTPCSPSASPLSSALPPSSDFTWLAEVGWHWEGGGENADVEKHDDMEEPDGVEWRDVLIAARMTLLFAEYLIALVRTEPDTYAKLVRRLRYLRSLAPDSLLLHAWVWNLVAERMRRRGIDPQGLGDGAERVVVPAP